MSVFVWTERALCLCRLCALPPSGRHGRCVFPRCISLLHLLYIFHPYHHTAPLDGAGVCVKVQLDCLEEEGISAPL